VTHIAVSLFALYNGNGGSIFKGGNIMRWTCIKVVALTILLALMLGGCDDAGALNVPDNAVEIGYESYASSSATSVIYDEADAAIMHFSQNLFREVLINGDANAVISPLSVYYVLAMAALGAEGETFDEFKAVLGMCPHELALELNILAERLMQTEGSTILNLAGSVWICDKLTIDGDFNLAMEYYFDAPALARDFRAEDTLREINRWIHDQTQELIEDAIDEIDPDVIMMLINTLYLSARWASVFNPMSKSYDMFYLESGETIDVPFLNTRRIALYVSVTEYNEAILLPYDDDRLGFFLVRPTDDTTIRDFATSNCLMVILGELEEREGVRVSMPSLDKENEIVLNGHMQALGLNQAFDDRSDFSGLIENAHLYPPIFISELLQTVRIKVNQEGTEAAAATVMVLELMSGSINPIDLNFNTPYIYMIYDRQTGVILFMGVVDNPLE